MLNKIIFSIDNDTDVHAVAKFMRHIDTARALNELKGSFIHCISCYDGMLESSYMMDERDYHHIVADTDYIKGQECIMHVPADTRQPCTLESCDKAYSFSIGPMRKVTPVEALQLPSWTYVIETNTYWTADV